MDADSRLVLLNTTHHVVWAGQYLEAQKQVFAQGAGMSASANAKRSIFKGLLPSFED